MKIILLGPAIIAVAGIVLVMMIGGGSPVAERLSIPLFLLFGALTAVGSLLLPRLIMRLRSLRRVILVVALAAMTTAGTTIAVSAGVMIVEPAQPMLLLVVAVMGAAFGLVVEYAVARTLSADALRLRVAAARIAKGDLDARSEVDRADEIGQAARAIDAMASRLETMETERRAVRVARQAFLTAVGHDLRTPLAALRAALDALEDGLAPDPPRYFAAMHRDIEAIRRLADDLFLLARIEAGGLQFERIQADLSELADEAVEAMTPMAVQQGVALRVATIGANVAEVGTSEFARAIRNLLDNAIRHAPSDTEIVLELTGHDGGVVVRVVDHGPGFSDELRRRAFDGIARTVGTKGRTRGGAGLGLTIARGLVEAHDGRIWIEDGPGGRVAMWVPARA